MATIITNPSAGDLSPVDKFHVVEGGTGAQIAQIALVNLGGIDRTMKGVAEGPVPLDAARMIPANFLSDYNPTTLGINGPLVVQCGTVVVYQLINYDSYETYVGEATVGEVAVCDDNHVLYTVPQKAGPCGFSVNGRSIALTAVEGMITRPEVFSPVEDAAVSGTVLTIQGSVFECVDTGPIFETFSSADCELSIYPDFSVILAGIYGNPNTTFVFQNPITELGPYIRIRYHGTTRSSEWSPNRHLTPAAKLVVPPTITYPVEGNANGVPDASDVFRRRVVVDVTLSAFAVENYIDNFLSADYEVSRFADFSDIYVSSYNNTAGEMTWRASNLYYSTLYYVRARHRGAELTSAWSSVVSFMTAADIRYIDKPSVLSATPDPSKSVLTYDFVASPYTTVNYQGPLGLSYWEVATDAGFTNLAYHGSFTGANTSNIQLNFNTTYYVRVYYVDNFKQSTWSDVFTFTTAADDRSVVPPSILSPVNNSSIATLTTGAESGVFQTSSNLVSFTDTHISSDWELSTESDFSTLVNSVYNSTTDKYYWNFGTLTYGLRYFVRVRYNGESKTSNWSNSTIFYTAETASGVYEVIGAGGGGGGGGSRNPGPDTYGNGGGGGGAGYRVTGTMNALYGQTYNVTVGAGGLKGNGVAAQGASGTIGQAGAQSAFDIYTANGGQPGKPGGMGVYTSESTIIGYDGEGSPIYSYSRVQIGTIGQGGVGSVNGNAGTAAGDNNSVPGYGGAGGNSPYGGDGGVGGNGGYYGQSGANGQDGVVVFEYPATMAQLVTTGATYSLVNGKHRYVWSVAGTYQFVIPDNRTVETPVLTIQGGVVGTPRIPVLLGSVFTPVNYSDTHESSDWQIATDAAFTNIVASSMGNVSSLTSWNPAVSLAGGTIYYSRLRYNGTVKTSEWSTAVQFTTIDNGYIIAPELVVGRDAVFNVQTNANLTAITPFTPVNYSDTYVGTEFQVAYDSAFQNIWNSITAGMVGQPGYMPAGVQLYARARHIGTLKTSAWGSVITFTPVDNGG